MAKRTGYTFLGWYTGKAKGSKVAATTKVPKDLVLYARWTKAG
ncbi:MAG: InlB B-repeat-containing protein [Coriobacteriales bacterium]|nr:InlB B-repeat-containing protein [Coriobacteriales bacterium]